MVNKLLVFGTDESGAITVDWVVLTSVVVAFGALMYVYLHESVENLDEASGQAIANVDVEELTFD